MELEQVKPDKPRIAYVGYLTIFMLVATLLAAAVIVTWRARAVKRTPYSKHPTSQLVLPIHPHALEAGQPQRA